MPNLIQLAQTMGAKATMRMLELFTSEMANVLENEQSVKHEKLSEQMEAKLEVPKTWKGFNPVPGVRSFCARTCLRAKLILSLFLIAQKKFDTALPDWCYTPIIQSGGAYDLRPSAQSDEGKLKAGVVLCSMGVRYKSYCANVGRTYLIDPDKVGFIPDFGSGVSELIHPFFRPKKTTSASWSSFRSLYSTR